MVATFKSGSTFLAADMSHSGGQGPSENMVPLLQLPHFDQDLLKRLQRKRVRTLQDLFCMPADERREVYAFGGMQPVQDLIIIARTGWAS